MSGCIEWSGGCFHNGYGMRTKRYLGRRVWKAHRYAYTRVYGPIPSGMLVCHTCDNRRCVNVMHLFLGTHQDNMDDMVRKGRQVPRTSKEFATTMPLSRPYWV